MEPKDAQPVGEPVTRAEPDNPRRARGIITLGTEDPTQFDEASFNEKASLFHSSKSPNFHVDEQFDYAVDQQAEGMTLGRGLYTTSNRDRAVEYMVHGVHESQDRVFSLIPYQARMLDLRQVEDPGQNAAIPQEIVAQWVAFAKPQIEARLQEWEGFVPKAISRRALSRLAVRLDHLAERDDVDLREDILGTWDSQARVATPGSQVADIWNAFCKAQGIDGVIYNEGGEMQFADVPDTTYVFNNLEKIGTHADWQRRFASRTTTPDADQQALDDVRARLDRLAHGEDGADNNSYRASEHMTAARTFFEQMGIPVDADGFISNDLTQEQVTALKKWRDETFIDSIDMLDEETFYRKVLLAASLWRQRDNETVNYLLGKGIGLEVSVRGQVKSRPKRPTMYSYRSHSDFELYNVAPTGSSPYPEAFKTVFGVQEYYPPTKTKGLRNLPEGFLTQTAEVVDLGGVEILVPQLELQFLDKWEKAGSHHRIEGSDAAILARQYDLDPERTHDYLERFVIQPGTEELQTRPGRDPQWHLDRVSRLITYTREQLVEDGVTSPTLEQVIARVNADMQGKIKIFGADSNILVGGVRVSLWRDLTPQQIGEDDRVIDEAFTQELTDRMEEEKKAAIARLKSKHEQLDDFIRDVDIDKAIEDRHIAATIDKLPPVSEGYVRWVHTTHPNYVLPILETGLDYEKYGMIDSTARPVVPDDPNSYFGTDIRFNYPGAKTIVFDLPMFELRLHRDVTKSPGALPSQYVVGIIDGYKAPDENL